MSKNVKNRLSILLVGVVLFLIVFNVIAFVVPFNNHYNILFWVSYVFFYLEVLPCVFALYIAGNQKEYSNDKCGNQVAILSCVSLVLAMVGSLVFMAVMIEQMWIPIVILSVVFVLTVLAVFYIFIQNKEEKTEE